VGDEAECQLETVVRVFLQRVDLARGWRWSSLSSLVSSDALFAAITFVVPCPPYVQARYLTAIIYIIMFARRIIATNVAFKTPYWKAIRCFACDAEAKDPARKLLDGTAKIMDLPTREIKAALDYRNLTYEDCVDQDSLRKRLAGCMLQEFKQEQEDKKRQAEVYMRAASLARVLKYLPQVHFSISKEITGFVEEVLLLIPEWEYQRVGAEFKKRGGLKNPDVAAKERDFLVNHFLREFGAFSGRGPFVDAKIGTAFLLLWFHSGGDGDDVRKVELDPTEEEKYEEIIVCLPPIPKNWKADLPGYSALGMDTEEIMKSITVARDLAGECEAVEGIEDIDVHRR